MVPHRVVNNNSRDHSDWLSIMPQFKAHGSFMSVLRIYLPLSAQCTATSIPALSGKRGIEYRISESSYEVYQIAGDTPGVAADPGGAYTGLTEEGLPLRSGEIPLRTLNHIVPPSHQVSCGDTQFSVSLYPCLGE